MSDTNMPDSVGDLDIAIIGMSGRFPGARNVKELWKNLCEGVESVSSFSDEELEESGIDRELIDNPNYVKSRGIIADADKFDATLFGLFPREVEILDPQQRLFLECSFEALSDAGYDPETYPGLIGVFGGVGMNTYLLSFLAAQQGFISSAEGYQLSIGNEKDFLTTRVSYKMNLRGPSVNLQTACSTSLVATHLACTNLLNYQCDMALAGGVTINFPQKSGYYYEEGMILSPDGHCRPFDSKAAGTVGGNGVGIVLLKRLSDALDDRDHIYAVIKGSASNNDGSIRVGYTAPGVDGQAEVIAAAQAVADIDPRTITYIETHGTGTVMGDPIEIAALTQAFRTQTQEKQFCAIGAVKANVGHLDTAAGVTGLIKTALALYHRQIPPSINYQTANPKIDFENSPFYVNTELHEWHNDNAPLRAGVSSFGIGGTNAHVILEEAPRVHTLGKSRRHKLLLLSAKSNSALDNATTDLGVFLSENLDVNLADVAFTLQTGRKSFDYRRMLVCESVEDASNALEKRDPRRLLGSARQQEPENLPVAFLFSGQGAQYVDMGRDLYQSETIFQQSVDECAEFLRPHLGLDLRDILYPPESEKAAATDKISQTWLTQPALFVIEYSLAKLWMSLGIQPESMIGHSIGEYVAACLSGVISLKDALKLVAERGRLMQKLPGGAMLSIPMAEGDVRSLLGDELALAAVNSQALCAVSGTFEAIDNFEKKLQEKGLEYRRLRTSHAFHSYMMEPILDEFTAEVKKIRLNVPQIPYLSNVSGTWITAEEAMDPAYYARHLRYTVRFSDNVAELLKDPERIFVEVGPGNTLASLTKSQPNIVGRTILNSMRHPKETVADDAHFLNALGRLWLAGGVINWESFYAEERRYRLSLPAYPYERKRYWLHSQKSAVPARGNNGSLAKIKDNSQWLYSSSWKRLDLPADTDLSAQSKWLLFIKEHGDLGKKIAEELQAKNQDVVTVFLGEKFEKRGDQQYRINPCIRTDFERLLGEFSTESLPSNLIHLWNAEDTKGSSFDEIQADGFYSLLYLTQALNKLNFTNSLNIAVVTENLQEVSGTEEINPFQAPVLGICRIIPQEFPGMHCRTIDIATAGNANSKEGISGKIISEFTDNNIHDSVAYRGRHRWIHEFQPVTLSNGINANVPLRKGGVYLITGGLGRIGLTFARYLAENYQAKLVILERNAFPPHEEWQKLVSKGSENPAVAAKITKLLDIEKAGAEILIVQADVADENQVKISIERTISRFKQLNGVIHAAGIVGDDTIRPIAELQQSMCEDQFQAKIHGTLALAKALRAVKPDFVLLQSSLSTVLGGFGFAAYAAANHFMDTFAVQNQSGTSPRWISVDWDGWEFDEEMHTIGLNSSVAEFSVSPGEGVDVFSKIISSTSLPRIIVSTGNLKSRLEKYVIDKQQKSNAKEDVEELIEAAHTRPNLPNPYVAPSSDLELKISKVWQKLLGIGEIGIYDDFFDLGGNSLLGTQLVSQLRQTFQVELPLRTLFEDPTISGVSKVISDEKKEVQEDTAKLAEFLKQVENMSEEQVKGMLAEKKK